jgi:hypothetical protein
LVDEKKKRTCVENFTPNRTVDPEVNTRHALFKTLRTQIMPGVMEDDEDNGDDSKKWVSKEIRDSTLGESDYFTDGFGATLVIRPERGRPNNDE